MACPSFFFLLLCEQKEKRRTKKKEKSRKRIEFVKISMCKFLTIKVSKVAFEI